MPALLLQKYVRGKWEEARGYVNKNFERIEQGFNALPPAPTFIPPRVSVIESSATPLIDVGAFDDLHIHKQNTNILKISVVGQPVDGQVITISIQDDGTPRTIAWSAPFDTTGTAIVLPTTTVPGQRLILQFLYHFFDLDWDCISCTVVTASSVIGGAAFTKTNDTNVTATLTGTPASALLKAVNIALGWTGLLGLARGGTNVDLSASGGTTKVLAQDASHVISARDLVAADIPSLDASTLTGTLADARLSANVPLLNVANTFSHTGNNFPDVTTAKHYFNAGMAYEAVDLGTVLNTAINALSLDGLVEIDATLLIITQGTGGFHVSSQMMLRGTDHGTIIVSDAGGILSTTKGTASKVNVYWDAGNARYEIENKSTISLRIAIFYLMLRN